MASDLSNSQPQRQVVLTQIAPPTRESVEAYSDIRHQLETLAGSINGRFGDRASWREPMLANPALFTTTDDLDRFVQALRPILLDAKGRG